MRAKRSALILPLMFLGVATVLSGCVLDGFGFGGGSTATRAPCDICTAENMSGSGFALPQKGVVIYQGTVKIYDLNRRTISFIATDPPLVRPRAATILARRDQPLNDADYTWASRMADAAWAPPPAKGQRGCASTDGRLPAMVVLIDQGKFFADYECGPEDASGQLSELTARADRMVAQRYPDVTPK